MGIFFFVYRIYPAGVFVKYLLPHRYYFTTVHGFCLIQKYGLPVLAAYKDFEDKL